MSFLRQLWYKLRMPAHYVGSDLKGNRFFEYPSTTSDIRRTRRRVVYKDLGEMFDNIGQGHHLPIQWATWMHHTRADPPTIEELKNDMYRQQRVAANVAQIEARDRENLQPQPRNLAANDQPQSISPKSVSLSKIPKEDTYEPEAWTPQAAPRHHD